MNVRRWSEKLRARQFVESGDGSLDRESLDALVDAVLDREVPEGERERVESVIRENRMASERLDGTREALDTIRTPVRAPDLSASILDEVERRRGWLDRPTMRIVTVGRLAMAASFLLLITAAFVTERVAPEAVRLSETPAPVTQLLETSQAEATSSLRNVASVIDSLRSPKPTTSGADRAASAPFERKWTHRFTFQGESAVLFVTRGEGEARSVVRVGAASEGDCQKWKSKASCGDGDLKNVLCLERLDGGVEFVRRTSCEEKPSLRIMGMPARIIGNEEAGRFIVNFERKSGSARPTAVSLEIKRGRDQGESSASAPKREDVGDGAN